jgi:acetyl esterase
MADEKKTGSGNRVLIISLGVVAVLAALIYFSGLPAIVAYLAVPSSDVSLSEGVTVEELEYLSHDGTPMLARVFKPRQSEPFPVVVSVHGGGWISGTRMNDENLHRALANRGIGVVALDFRTGRSARYPESVADVHFGIRWARANAARFGARPDWVGAMGGSTGGHLVALATMRPDDPRYAAIHAPGVPDDLTVPFVVINPPGRYRHFQSDPGVPWIIRRAGIAAHDSYWGSEERMTEGSPVIALEQGEHMTLPDMLYVQNEQDNLHPRADRERFVSAYRQAGGNLDLQLFRGAAYNTPVSDPATAESERIIGLIVDFVKSRTSAMSDPQGADELAAGINAR